MARQGENDAAMNERTYRIVQQARDELAQDAESLPDPYVEEPDLPIHHLPPLQDEPDPEPAAQPNQDAPEPEEEAAGADDTAKVADDAATAHHFIVHMPAPRKKRDAGQKRPNFFRRALDHWFDRLLGAAAERTFSDQDALYAAHRTSQDFLWNSIGNGAWSMVFPLLTIVVTQLSGVEDAGRFSLAVVVATLLMFGANYGVRFFQASDQEEEQSFADYQVHRWILCVGVTALVVVACLARGFGHDMMAMTMWVLVYRMADSLGDVYEGRLQQMDKLYLAGVSQMIRSVAVLAVFVVFLLVTRNLVVSSAAMGVVALGTLVLYTMPLAFFETPRSRRFTFRGVGRIFRRCFPLFLALFLYTLIDNMPKFLMDGVLAYENQLYFNAIYFPAHAVLLFSGIVYKPLLVRMTNVWADASRRRRFDLTVLAMLAVVVLVAFLVASFMGWAGIDIMGFLYGVDFQQFDVLIFLMLAAGGLTAGIEFLYQVITIMRRQGVITRLYLVTFGVSVVASFSLIRLLGLAGAVYAYVLTMAVLFVLLVVEYVKARVVYERHPERDPIAAEQRKARAAQRKRAAEEEKSAAVRAEQIRSRLHDRYDR